VISLKPEEGRLFKRGYLGGGIDEQKRLECFLDNSDGLSGLDDHYCTNRISYCFTRYKWQVIKLSAMMITSD
jgi:hypothetical protein